VDAGFRKEIMLHERRRNEKKSERKERHEVVDLAVRARSLADARPQRTEGAGLSIAADPRRPAVQSGRLATPSFARSGTA
jgi:hypothetical protein